MIRASWRGPALALAFALLLPLSRPVEAGFPGPSGVEGSRPVVRLKADPTLVVGRLRSVGSAEGQTRPRQRTRTPPAPPKREPAQVTCPATVGTGVKTARVFCDVLTGRDPADGILIKIPPHTGAVTLTFDLHARHTYSEELVKKGAAFARYTATVGILTMNNDLVDRAMVQAEFRTIADAFDRIGGGAGPHGVKAVVPVSIEPVTMVLKEAPEQVSLLGEKLRVTRVGGESTAASPGQPVALVSNIQIEYQPAPAKAPPKPTKKKTP